MSTTIPAPKPYATYDNHRPAFTVLLVEDDPDDEALTLRALRRTGLPILVRVVRDGHEAVQALVGEDSTHPSELPQLVLLDLKLPKVNGLDVLQRVRADRTPVPIVCMTSSDEETDLTTAYARGANAFLRKPSDYERYLEVVGTTARWWLDMNRLPSHPHRFGTRTFQSVYEMPSHMGRPSP